MKNFSYLLLLSGGLFLIMAFRTDSGKTAFAERSFTTLPFSACQVPIDSSMFYNEDGSPASTNSGANNLGDEQAIMGDPIAGSGNTTNSYSEWSYPYGSNKKSYIDLGQDYDISEIYLFDYTGSDTFKIYVGLPGASSVPIISVYTNQYKQWRAFTSLGVTARYLTFEKVGDGAKIGEIAICGTVSSSSCALTSQISNITCDDNGTDTDGSDDKFYFDLLVTRSDTSAGTWTATIGGQSESGSYGTSVNLGPYDISGGDLSFTIMDQTLGSCTVNETVTAPASCSSGGSGSSSAWANGTNTTNNIHRTGKVAIGTSTFLSDTSSLLYVNGIIRAEKVKVELCSAGGWCDYVFRPDYILKPLAEVEQFIAQNGHLPDVPSESALMAEEVLDLGAISVIQQQKIEELFLYVIEMNKEIEVLKQEVNQLRQEKTKLKSKLD